MNSSCSPPNISVTQLTYLKQISLKNYYVSDVERKTVNCKICKFDMPNHHVFEHTVGKRHKYNKLLVRIIQDSSYNGDMDFIITGIDSLQCRYCNTLVINSNENDCVVNHLQSVMHTFRKQKYLRRSSCSSVEDLPVQCDTTLRPLDSLLTYDKKYKNRIRNSSKNLPKPSKASVIVKVNTQQSSACCSGKDTQGREKIPKCITVDQNGICVCTVCSKHIPNSTMNINQHINGKAHKNQLQELQETAGKDVEFDCPSNLFQEPKDIEDSQSYWCKFCCIKLPNNEQNIEQHNTGKKHQSNIKTLYQYLKKTQGIKRKTK